MERIDQLAGTFDRRRAGEELARTDVSPAVIRRLPRYHRFLGELLRDNRLRISSSELSKLLGVTASQIRQDLNCFGGFGQQGYGYNVKYLHAKIGELLGINAGFSAVIVGAGNLGRALASSRMFERRGVTRAALFDVQPSLIGTEIAGLHVYHVDSLTQFCTENQVQIGVLTTPKEAAVDVADKLVRGGVRGIWNFSNMELHLEGTGVTVENIHLGDSLMTLCYAMLTAESPTSESPTSEGTAE